MDQGQRSSVPWSKYGFETKAGGLTTKSSCFIKIYSLIPNFFIHVSPGRQTARQKCYAYRRILLTFYCTSSVFTYFAPFPHYIYICPTTLLPGFFNRCKCSVLFKQGKCTRSVTKQTLHMCTLMLHFLEMDRWAVLYKDRRSAGQCCLSGHCLTTWVLNCCCIFSLVSPAASVR